MPLALEWLSNTNAQGLASRDGLPSKWLFPSGATIEFGHVQHEANKTDYQGAAYQFVGFDELTHFTKSIYDYIGFSRTRRRLDMSDIPVQTYSTANPGGVGHLWVKERFIDSLPDNALFIPAKVRDNPGLDAEQYIEDLNYLDPDLRKQLLEGDWKAFLGAAYKLDPEAHVVPVFDIPAQWERFEFMDHGVANATAWYVCAVDYDGNAVVFDEHYEEETVVSEHVPVILGKRAGRAYDFKGLRFPGGAPWYPAWVSGEGALEQQAPRVFSDPSVTHRAGWTTKHGVPASIATEYSEQSDGKIVLIPGNNDRQAGHLRIKELTKLDPSHRFPDWHPRRGEFGAPRLFISEACEKLIEQLEGAMLEPIDSGKREAGEVVSGTWEARYGHAHAALRYGMLTWPDASEYVAPPPEDPRVALLQKYEARMNDYESVRASRYIDA
jgi:hypothetical protein